jgi:hypothetical protein
VIAIFAATEVEPESSASIYLLPVSDAFLGSPGPRPVPELTSVVHADAVALCGYPQRMTEVPVALSSSLSYPPLTSVGTHRMDEQRKSSNNGQALDEKSIRD